MKAIVSVALLLVPVLGLAGGAWAQDHRYTREFVELNTIYATRCAEGAAEAAKTSKFNAEAHDYCTQAIETEPLSRAYLAKAHMNRGILEMVRDERGAARKDLDRALYLDGKLGQAFVSRAWLNLTEDKNQAALADANKAIGVGAATAQAYYNRAAANEALGYAQRAYRDYQQAANLDPSWDRPKKELARFQVTRR